MGEMTGEDGRKAYVRTTLLGPAGTVLARARATWFTALSEIDLVKARERFGLPAGAPPA